MKVNTYTINSSSILHPGNSADVENSFLFLPEKTFLYQRKYVCNRENERWCIPLWRINKRFVFKKRQ